MDERTLRERTKQTARMLFHTLTSGTGFELWKKFDRGLARELSMFFTGVLYSREVLSQKHRELCAVAAWGAVEHRSGRRDEALLRGHSRLGDADRGGGARRAPGGRDPPPGDGRALHRPSGRGGLPQRRAHPGLGRG